MRAPSLLAAFALVLAAGGAWMLLADEAAETPRPIHSPATADVTDLDDLVVRSAGPGSEALDPEALDLAGLGRVEVGSEADAGDDAAAEGLEVLVLDGDVPVADAEVFWGDENELQRRGREAELSRRIHDGALAARFGARAVTGPDGRVSLPPVSMREPELAARKGELFGTGERPPNGEALALEALGGGGHLGDRSLGARSRVGLCQSGQGQDVVDGDRGHGGPP